MLKNIIIPIITTIIGTIIAGLIIATIKWLKRYSTKEHNACVYVQSNAGCILNPFIFCDEEKKKHLEEVRQEIYDLACDISAEKISNIFIRKKADRLYNDLIGIYEETDVSPNMFDFRTSVKLSNYYNDIDNILNHKKEIVQADEIHPIDKPELYIGTKAFESNLLQMRLLSKRLSNKFTKAERRRNDDNNFKSS